MATLKELALKDDIFTAGHSLCPGCGIPVILKVVLRAAKAPLVITNASGCLQQASAMYPRTNWKSNWLHTSDGNAASTMSGVAAMYRSLKKKGKLPADKERKFLVVGGDGAVYDSGFGAMSCAMERGDNAVYLCYDNQLAANSGGQGTSATPMGASTLTTPAGEVLPGKLWTKKKLNAVISAQNVSYVAQTAPWIWQDMYRKAEKAFDVSGPAFLNVLSPCPGRWKMPTAKSIELTRLAADTCIWPIYEITAGNNGKKVVINYKPKQKLPVTEWLKSQDRFKHLLVQENKWIVDKIQEEVDKDWELLISMQGQEENKRRDN
jgi:pyruvate ferredoxin oxidoreductase beta subunit